MAVTLPAVEYEAPPVLPAGQGLYEAATINPDAGGATRILGEGVRVRPYNCGTGFGTWADTICADPTPDLKKTGARAEAPDPFAPLTVWTYDDCDLTEGEAAIEARANQLMRLKEPLLAESAFAARLLDDISTAAAVTDIVAAVGALEEGLGETGFLGVIHASRRFAAQAAAANLVIRSGSLLKTPLGHTWAFGGGYASGLGNTLVATGPVTVWRDATTTRSVVDFQHNVIAGVAERSIVVGYECYAEGVTVTPGAGAGGDGFTLVEDPPGSGLYRIVPA